MGLGSLTLLYINEEKVFSLANKVCEFLNRLKEDCTSVGKAQEYAELIRKSFFLLFNATNVYETETNIYPDLKSFKTTVFSDMRKKPVTKSQSKQSCLIT